MLVINLRGGFINTYHMSKASVIMLKYNFPMIFKCQWLMGVIETLLVPLKSCKSVSHDALHATRLQSLFLRSNFVAKSTRET